MSSLYKAILTTNSRLLLRICLERKISLMSDRAARYEKRERRETGGLGASGVVDDGHAGMLQMWCKRIDRERERNQGVGPAGGASQSEGLTDELKERLTESDMLEHAKAFARIH